MRKKALFFDDSNVCVAAPNGSFIVLKFSTKINDELKNELVGYLPSLFEHYSKYGETNILLYTMMELAPKGLTFEINEDENFKLYSKVVVGDDNRTITVVAKDGEVFNIQSKKPLADEEVLRYSIDLARSFDEHFCDDKSYMTYKVFIDMVYIKWQGLIEFIGSDRYEERERIGNRIREIREEKNMKAKYLAQKAGIDASNWSRIEDGSYSVGLDTLHKIAKALGKRIDFVDNG